MQNICWIGRCFIFVIGQRPLIHFKASLSQYAVDCTNAEMRNFQSLCRNANVYHRLQQIWSKVWTPVLSLFVRKRDGVTSSNGTFATNFFAFPPFFSSFGNFAWKLKKPIFRLFQKWPSSASFPFILGLFKQIIQILQQINVKNCTSNIWFRDSDSWPLEHQSFPIISRPGLLPVWPDLAKF